MYFTGSTCSCELAVNYHIIEYIDLQHASGIKNYSDFSEHYLTITGNS